MASSPPGWAAPPFLSKGVSTPSRRSSAWSVLSHTWQRLEGEQKNDLLHCSLSTYRTSAPLPSRGHLLDAALLKSSSCTCLVSCKPRPPHPRRGQKGWLARPHQWGVKLFHSTQEGKIPTSHSLRASCMPWGGPAAHGICSACTSYEKVANSDPK